MSSYQEITCHHCNSNRVTQAGHNAHGEQRYRCQEADCPIKIFMLKYRYRACELGIKERIIDMAINGSGIRDTGRVLKINKNTVISVLKNKASSLVQVNPKIVELSASSQLNVRLEKTCIEAELDEQWSWVEGKSNQRWLWHAVEGLPQPKA